MIGINTNSAKLRGAETQKRTPQRTGEDLNLPLDSVHISSLDKAQMSVYPQDGLIDKKPVTAKIDKFKSGNNLTGVRVKISDSRYKNAQSDSAGNFIFEPDKPEFAQTNAFFAAQKTLDMHEAYAGHKIGWAFSGETLSIDPHFDKEPNAYYKRGNKSVVLGYFDCNPLKEEVFAAKSSDMVSHETGHAILDGLKPNYITNHNIENRAFMEAFGDCTTMLYNFTLDENIDALIRETGGDLSKNNRLSMMGEEFGKKLRIEYNDPGRESMPYLRSFINNYKYSPPESLPKVTPKKGHPEDNLTAETHSFSRIFSGAFYDCINSVYKKNFAKTGNIKSSLKNAGDTMGKVLLKAVELMPSSSATFKDGALAMLASDRMTNRSENFNELSSIFLKREIIKPEDLNKLKSDGSPLKLDREISDEKDAIDFLNENKDKIGAAAEEYNSATVTKDSMENTIIQYSGSREVELREMTGKKENAYIDVQGGLTLAFNKNGALVSKIEDRISDEKIKSTMAAIKKVKDEGLIKDENETEIFKSDGKPYEAQLVKDPQTGKMKLVRIPVIID